MDCQTAREMCTRLLEWDLSAQEQTDLGLHLTDCADCRAEFDASWTLREAFVDLRNNPVEPPPGLVFSVMRQVETASPVILAFHRSKAAIFRRMEKIGLILGSHARIRTALSAAALALVAVVAVGSLYINNMGSLFTVAQTPTAVSVPTAPPRASAPASAVPLKPKSVSQPTTTAPVVAPSAPAATPTTAPAATMTSVWVNTNNLSAVNQQLSTLAGQHNANYQVFSLSSAPGGNNKEFVRITLPATGSGITDNILTAAAALGKVVNTETSAASNGQDVITAFVSGPAQ